MPTKKSKNTPSRYNKAEFVNIHMSDELMGEAENVYDQFILDHPSMAPHELSEHDELSDMLTSWFLDHGKLSMGKVGDSYNATLTEYSKSTSTDDKPEPSGLLISGFGSSPLLALISLRVKYHVACEDDLSWYAAQNEKTDKKPRRFG